MEVNLPALIEYLDVLLALKDGEEIVYQGRTIKRMGNRIWEHLFYYSEEGFDEEDGEGEEEV